MQPVHLVDGHLPLLEPLRLDGFAKVANHQVAIESLLFRESGRIDRLELAQKDLRLCIVAVDRSLREITEPVVVALVAEDGGELGGIAEGVLPLLVEELVEIRYSRIDAR